MRRPLLIAAAVLCLAAPASAQATSPTKSTDVVCTKPGAVPDSVMLATIKLQTQIAEQRDSARLDVAIRTKGTLTIRAQDATGAVVSQATAAIREPYASNDQLPVDLTGLPPVGDLVITADILPTGGFYDSYGCPPVTVATLKRIKGRAVLGPWRLTDNFNAYEIFGSEQNDWGGFRESGNFDSCQVFAKVPAVFEVSSSGSAGRGSARVVVPDQCDLWMGTATPKRVKLPGGTLRITRWKAMVTNTLRREGEQRIRMSVTMGDATRKKTGKASYFPGYRIWEDTDAFVNTCINDGLEIMSSGGRLYCDIPPLRSF